MYTNEEKKIFYFGHKLSVELHIWAFQIYLEFTYNICHQNKTLLCLKNKNMNKNKNNLYLDSISTKQITLAKS